MTDKKDNVKLVNFREQKDQEEKVPDYVIKQIELLLEKAKSGELESAIVHFDYNEDNSEHLPVCTFMWNKSGNMLEILGMAEIVKSFALDKIFYEE